jgi:hypothetical protein
MQRKLPNVQKVPAEHFRHRSLRVRVGEGGKISPKAPPVLQRRLESKVPISETTAWLQAISRVIENEEVADAAKDCSRTAYILRSEPVSNKLYILVAHRLALKNDNKTSFYASTIGSLKGQPGEPVDDLNQLILTCFPNPAIDGLSFFPDDSELSELLLRRLVATKKCFWKTPCDKPLLLGEARVASFAWCVNQDGKQSLKLSAGSEHSTCAQAGGYFYVDQELNQIGPLITKLPANLVSALLSGPPVSTTEAAVLSTKLNVSDVDILLVPPKVIPQEQVAVARPLPFLKLEQLVLRFPHHGPMRRYAAVLTFDYGDWRCHPNSDELVCFKDGKNFVSKRHKDFEATLLNRLTELGMKTGEPVVKNAIPVGAVVTRFDYPENAQWLNFMTTHVPALAKEGWRIEVDSSFPHRMQVLNCEQLLSFTMTHGGIQR